MANHPARYIVNGGCSKREVVVFESMHDETAVCFAALQYVVDGVCTGGIGLDSIGVTRSNRVEWNAHVADDRIPVLVENVARQRQGWDCRKKSGSIQ